MMTSRIKRILNLTAVLFLLTGFGISSAQAALSDHFVTTWKTDNPGSSNDTSITVPMVGGPYDVDWDNDGVLDEFWLTGPVTHDFGVAGTYTIRIYGSYSSIRFENAGDKDKIVSLDQWGTQPWTTMYRAFDGCSNIEIPATDTPNFSAAVNMSMTSMFDGAASANPDTSGWDTSSVKFMSYMFYGATSANPDTSGWDTSSVQYLHYMFYGATSANPDTSGWDTSSVRDMQSMFAGATAANPDTSSWNTSSVTDMRSMFAGATAASPDTRGWDTSSVTNMYAMFAGATAANPDTSGWNTSLVTSMQSMFEGASAANPDTSGWGTSSVTDMSNMFLYATSANPDTSGWDTSSVVTMGNMFDRATSANPDTSGWNTSSVSDMRSMFSGATSANPDTSGWDTSSVSQMRSMFSQATSANPDTSGWDTSWVVNTSYMFYKATSANPDTSGWDMSRVTDTRRMFYRVTLSKPNYEALLINWNAQALKPGLTFDGGNSTYCSNAAANARANMINSDGWTITDGGQDCAAATATPTAVTSPASNISDGGARLNGSADPNGANTSAWFQWGTSTAYGNTTSQTNVGSGTSPVSYNFNLSTLACGTTYHFRAVAQNSGGTAYGIGRNFTTSACSTPPPTAVTSPASNISDGGARLNGTADPNGASTNAWFQWGTSTAYGNTTSQTNVGSGTSPVSYNFNLSTLACGTTYHFRAVAQNSGGTAYGIGRNFTTSACSTPPPTAVTSPASNISDGGARLNGSADPNGASTNAWFQWGTSTAYGNTTSQTNVGSGTSPVSYNFNLSTLACGTTYHFRAVAQNSGGTAYGIGRNFTTSACSTTTPTVVTSPASSIGTSWALLNGTVDPNGASTTAWFEWGTSTAYGNTTALNSVGSGTSPVSATSALGGLQSCTTYHFRAVAENSGGTAYGSDRSFTTSACSTTTPTVVTSPASSIGTTGARLNGTADPNGAATSAWFQWGTSTAYGNTTSQTNVGSGTSPVSYNFNLSTLACGTTYHFRAVAQNSGGTAYGIGRNFTTSACSTPPPTAVTSPASNISDGGARLNGSADPNGANTSAWFQWGTSTAYGNTTSQTNVGSGTSPVSYNFNLSTLACETTYNFRAVAQNSGGTDYGSNRSFTTSTCEGPTPGEEEVILESRFETASKEGWSSKGKVSIDGVLAIDQYSLRHEKGAESVYSVMTTGYEDVSVTMHLAATSLRSGDACFAEVSTDGGDSWMPIVTLQNGESSGAFYSGKEFPPGADNNLDVKLRFRASGKGNPGYCYGDEVYVMGTPIGG